MIKKLNSFLQRKYNKLFKFAVNQIQEKCL